MNAVRRRHAASRFIEDSSPSSPRRPPAGLIIVTTALTLARRVRLHANYYGYCNIEALFCQGVFCLKAAKSKDLGFSCFFVEKNGGLLLKQDFQDFQYEGIRCIAVP